MSIEADKFADEAHDRQDANVDLPATFKQRQLIEKLITTRDEITRGSANVAITAFLMDIAAQRGTKGA